MPAGRRDPLPVRHEKGVTGTAWSWAAALRAFRIARVARRPAHQGGCPGRPAQRRRPRRPRRPLAVRLRERVHRDPLRPGLPDPGNAGQFLSCSQEAFEEELGTLDDMGGRIVPGMLSMLGEQFDSVIFPVLKLLYRLAGEEWLNTGRLMSSLGADAGGSVTSLPEVFLIESTARLNLTQDLMGAIRSHADDLWRIGHPAAADTMEATALRYGTPTRHWQSNCAVLRTRHTPAGDQPGSLRRPSLTEPHGQTRSAPPPRGHRGHRNERRRPVHVASGGSRNSQRGPAEFARRPSSVASGAPSNSATATYHPS
jgi:hypothetical protein